MKSALITGITGQDGSFLAELLLTKGYKVFGLVRNLPGKPLPSYLSEEIQLCYGDVTREADIASAIQQSKPDEVYHLASQSKPGESWSNTSNTLVTNGIGAVNLFEAVRTICPHAKIYHASSSEMFGKVLSTPQSENTPFNPANPYAAAKLYAHQMARIYRESYDLFIACGILFNHESERRPLYFVTQKVAYGAACAALGITDSPDLNEKGRPIVLNGKLALGNLEIARDWGYATDFVKAMWLILQHPTPDDFVIGTGRLHTLRDLCRIAYQSVGKSWQDYIVSDTALIRPSEPSQTVADASKAFSVLKWKPAVEFEEMIHKMVKEQVNRLIINQHTNEPCV